VPDNKLDKKTKVMGLCRSCLTFSGYATVVLASVLVFFHLECRREKEEELKNKTNPEFLPELTDCSVSLGFTKKGQDVELRMGMEYILVQSSPCAVNKLVLHLGTFLGGSNAGDFKESSQKHNVMILDARRESPGTFLETGFTLITLDKEPVTTDWRTTFYQNATPDIIQFHTQMEPYIMELYPKTKKMLWAFNAVRGGDRFGDQPRAVGGPHLDYYQDDEARIEFHKEFPEFEDSRSEAKLMMEKLDDEDHKLGVILGVWKPLSPEKVCDYPLALMDARTFQPENLSKNKLHINFMPGVTFHNLNGAVSYSEDQKWYYYPYQTPLEVLIFHQYSKGKWLNNPHTSFLNKNCPKDSEERISVELRVGLFF